MSATPADGHTLPDADSEETIWLRSCNELEVGDVVELTCTYAGDPAGAKVVGAITELWYDDGRAPSEPQILTEIEVDEHPGRRFRLAAASGDSDANDLWELGDCWRPIPDQPGVTRA